ncbi:MAG: hypothetical protein Ct9H300mP1_10120 [Planctomycetaceae bacterium]|nr:MAG: hypothetical protein Ct9H300mP1_10120 [Planctomycetaceae bacterium]
MAGQHDRSVLPGRIEQARRQPTRANPVLLRRICFDCWDCHRHPGNGTFPVGPPSGCWPGPVDPLLASPTWESDGGVTGWTWGVLPRATGSTDLDNANAYPFRICGPGVQ